MTFKPDIPAKAIEKKPSIKEQANYKGDWTLLLRDRLLDPITKTKFIKTKQKEIQKIQDLLKEDYSKDNEKVADDLINEILDQINDYGSTVEKVFSYTKIGSKEITDEGFDGGVSTGWGDQGKVFTDNKYSKKQKNIMESHEKGHGIRHYKYDPDNIADCLDEGEFYNTLEGAAMSNFSEMSKIRDYYFKPMEILERMSELKNYFGMNAGDVFTKEHLYYAQDHYPSDIDDNSVSGVLFLYSVTSETEDKFLEIMNSYPI